MVSASRRRSGAGGHRDQPGLTLLPLPGISLVLRAEQQDRLPLLSTEAGIKVMIHERDHPPFLEHQGFSVRPGTETTIGIREVGGPRPSHSPLACPTLGPQGPGTVGLKHSPSPQDEVRRLGSPYSHCTHSVEGVGVPLLYNASYTLQVSLAPRGGRNGASQGGRRGCQGRKSGAGLGEGGEVMGRAPDGQGGQALPHTVGEGRLPLELQPVSPAVSTGLPGILLPAADGRDLLLRLLLLPSAVRGAVLQLRPAPRLG